MSLPPFNNKNLYTVLGLESGQHTDKDIKIALRRAASIFHPDRNPNEYEKATQCMKDINNAYTRLSTHELRVAYDRTLINQQSESASSTRPPPPNAASYYAMEIKNLQQNQSIKEAREAANRKAKFDDYDRRMATMERFIAEKSGKLDECIATRAQWLSIDTKLRGEFEYNKDHLTPENKAKLIEKIKESTTATNQWTDFIKKEKEAIDTTSTALTNVRAGRTDFEKTEMNQHTKQRAEFEAKLADLRASLAQAQAAQNTNDKTNSHTGDTHKSRRPGF
jgi:curved DNA-binding protein CbpA